jgi:hypothetical protein
MALGRSSDAITNDLIGRGKSRSPLFRHSAINLRRTTHPQDPVTLRSLTDYGDASHRIRKSGRSPGLDANRNAAQKWGDIALIKGIADCNRLFTARALADVQAQQFCKAIKLRTKPPVHQHHHGTVFPRLTFLA